MTTWTTDDRKEAEKKTLEVPPDWSANSAPWPFTEDDLQDPEEQQLSLDLDYNNNKKT
jgi:hypothetical protein